MSVHAEDLTGCWYACGACGLTGHSVDLYAGCQGLTPGEATVELGRRLNLPQLDARLSTRCDRMRAGHETMRGLWRRIVEAGPPSLSCEIGDVLRWHGLRPDRPARSWAANAGRVCGLTHRTEVDRTFFPSIGAKTAHLGPGRIFPGNGWGTVLAFPLWDVPGRIRAMAFLGRDGRPSDWAARATNFNGGQGTPGQEATESGLALLPAALEAMAAHDDLLFILGDPSLAARLQLGSLDATGVPLPITFGLETPRLKLRLTPAFLGLSGRRLVFWGKPTPALFAQARAAEGRVAPPGARDGDLVRYADRAGDALLDHIARKARPWRDALVAHLSTLEPMRAADFTRRLDLEIRERRELAAACPPYLRAAIAGAAPPDAPAAIIRGVPVFDRGTAWVGRRVTLCDTPIVIDAVLQEPRRVTRYRGRILQDGREVPFLEVAKVLETDAVAWLRAQVLNAGGRPPEVSMSLASGSMLLDTALRLNPPRVIRVRPGPGWDARAAEFAFPGFAIRLGGSWTWDDPGRVPPGHSVLAPPEAIEATTLAALSRRGDGVSLGWAVLLATLRLALAEPCGLSALPLAISTHPNDGDLITEALTAVGASRVGPAAARDARLARWPVWIPEDIGGNRRRLRLLDRARGPLVVPVPDVHGAARALDGAALWLSHDGCDGTPVPFAHLGPTLVAYLTDLARRRLRVTDPRGPLTAIGEDVARWWVDRGGDPTPIAHGGTWLFDAHRGSDLAARFIAGLFRSRNWTCRDGVVRPGGRRAGARPLTPRRLEMVLQGTEMLTLRCDMLTAPARGRTATAQSRAPRLDKLRAALEAAGAFRGAIDRDGAPCWRLSGDWLRSAVVNG
jgi:hypothetical protein